MKQELAPPFGFSQVYWVPFEILEISQAIQFGKSKRMENPKLNFGISGDTCLVPFWNLKMVDVKYFNGNHN